MKLRKVIFIKTFEVFLNSIDLCVQAFLIKILTYFLSNYSRVIHETNSNHFLGYLYFYENIILQ